MKFRVFDDAVVFEIGSLPVTETMLASLGVSVVLVIVAALLRVAIVHRPRSTSAALAKLTVSWLDQSVAEIVGCHEPAVATLCGSLFIFIAASNISGQLPGVSPATASLATTSAPAIVVFFAVPVTGIGGCVVSGAMYDTTLLRIRSCFPCILCRKFPGRWHWPCDCLGTSCRAIWWLDCLLL